MTNVCIRIFKSRNKNTYLTNVKMRICKKTKNTMSNQEILGLIPIRKNTYF